MATNSSEYQLSLNEEERTELLRLLDDSVVEINAELRRTDSPENHEQLRNNETIVQALTEKEPKLLKSSRKFSLGHGYKVREHDQAEICVCYQFIRFFSPPTFPNAPKPHFGSLHPLLATTGRS